MRNNTEIVKAVSVVQLLLKSDFAHTVLNLRTTYSIIQHVVIVVAIKETSAHKRC